jgi:uncharacterized protein with von Willebrand factor type A (vWA) domain
MTRRSRYGAWNGGRDPLTPPFDVRAAVDELGDRLLTGTGLRDALADLRQRSGLADLRERVRERRRQAHGNGRLDGALLRAQSLLDQALAAERDTLTEQGDDAAAFAQAQLDALPPSLAQTIQELRSYDWVNDAARADYQRILDELREDVLGQRFAGLKESLTGQDEAATEAMRQMLVDLNALLAQHAMGHDTTELFATFMAEHGQFFPQQPQSVEELLDELAQQAAAGDRLMRSLSPDQRAELGDLINQSMGPLAQELGQLSGQLKSLRPTAFTRGRPVSSEGEPLSYTDAASAVAELADLDALLQQLGQEYPGASLDDIDVEAVARQLGAGAADDIARLRELDRELRQQGWLTGTRAEPGLSPKALRQLGSTALAAIFDQLAAGRSGPHNLPTAGAAGERTGASRQWQFGDEQPLDVVRTLGNAVRRVGSLPSSLAVEDFEVVETERRASAAVALCVDLSFSMISQGRWAPMKRTALALSHLIATRFPQDALQIIGFGRYAAPLTLAELALVEPDGVQGTNLQHALRLAGGHLRRHSDSDPIVLVVTDGEPTAHLQANGEAVFDWPPLPQTVQLTVVEVDHLSRYGASLNTFMLGEDPSLRRFVDAIARRCGGRVLTPSADDLGSYVISDYLRTRSGR